MKIKYLYIGLTVAGCLSITAISCQKELDKLDPNGVLKEDYFKTSSEIVNAANSMYSALHSVSLVGREWFFLHDLRSDDVAAGGGQLEVPRAQILNGATSPSNSVMNSVWNGLYTVVHRANTVIVNGPNITDNTALRDRSVAEAKFLRGWAYFELVSKWGGVPIYTAPVNLSSEFQPRSSVEDVYALVVKDLEEAAVALPGKYALGDKERGRATNAAANALLGRVYMQMGDYGKAKTALLKIPTTGPDAYTLTSRYLDNFEEETEFNAESIFEVVFFDKGDNNFNWGGNGVGDGPTANQSTVRNQEYNPVAWRNLIPSNRVLNEFENTATGAAKTDPRYSFTFYQTGDTYNNGASVLTDGDQNGNSSVVNGVTKKVSWRKFMILYKESKSQANFHPGGNNQRVIRFAEVLLMLAECEAELGNLPGAVGYLNQLRARPSVDMPPYPTAQFPVGTKDQVIKAIMHEKTAEMANEQVRNLDILRWRKKGYFTTEPLSYFTANKDELLPIPIAEIDNNPKLGESGVAAQNPGY
jgi:starch-binding outer membrane protein, SusD/RagB family